MINTIRFCSAMVYESHKHNENTVFNFKPFKFNGFPSKASYFFIRFVIDQIEYEYSFSLTRTEILTESLYHYPHGRRARIFERNEKSGRSKKSKYVFGTSGIKRPLDVAQNTSDKTLFVSRASQMDREIPKKVFHFFHSTFILRHSSYGMSNIEPLVNSHKKKLLKALQLADTDIIDFKYNLKREKGKRLNANLD